MLRARASLSSALVCLLCLQVLLVATAFDVEGEGEYTVNEIDLTGHVQARVAGDHSVGGYHMATGVWWEPQQPYSVTLNDWDGDGVLNSNDDHPMDPALPTGDFRRGLSCLDLTINCVSDPTPAPFNSAAAKVYAQGSAAISTDWADVDNDGDLDLAIGNNGAKNAVYLNQGNGLESTPSWNSSDSLVSIDLAWGDYDSDGDADLAVANYEGAIQIFQNQGGTLSTTATWSHLYGGSTTTSRFTSLAWGDIDGDNDLDLVAGVLYEGVVMFRNSGSSFGSSTSWQGGHNANVMDVKLADVDGDNDLDLFEAVSGGRVSLYLNSGATFSSSVAWQSPTDLSTSTIALGDVDADGDMDLVVGNHGGLNQLFLNDAGTLSNSADWYSSESDNTMDIRLADVDMDGDLDMLESNTGTYDNIRIFDGSGFGSSIEWATPDIGDSSDSAWGDVDGDGDLDFATADGNDGPLIFINGGQMLQSSASWNDGATEYSYSMDLGDMDGDGDLDMLIGNSGSVSKVYEFDDTTQSYSLFWSTSSNYYSNAMLWFDYDYDGDPDVFIGDYNGQNLGFRNDLETVPGGDIESLDSNTWISSDSDDTTDLAAGDINGDGRADLVSVNDGKNRIYPSATHGGGYRLATSASWSSSDSKSSMCAELADFNGDGNLDMFVGNYGEVDQIFFNTGSTLSTTAGWSSLASMNAQGCDVGDVDGDGDVDIVVANENQPNQLYLNPGTGNFATSQSWQAPNSIDTVSIGLWDVDNDGDLDMVEGNYQSNNYIRLNEAGTFSNIIWTSPDILDTWVLRMGDINDDGAIDLAVANEQQTNQVFFGAFDQDGDWVSEPSDEVPSDPTQVSDQDEDGFGDLIQGRLPDGCIGYWGDSWRDRFGCPDLDGDGESDLNDAFFQNATQWNDSDGDGFGDNWGNVSWISRSSSWPGEFVEDAFLQDPSPLDFDNDGFEDFSLQGEGAGGNFDDCPLQFGTSWLDSFGCLDGDGDGTSDSADDFPSDSTQVEDSDGDGWGDNPNGFNPDRYPSDSTQHSDTDGDGYGDNESGNNPDMFPFESTQWSDGDGDGYGDNTKGSQPDSCREVFGNSSIDKYGCIDSDGDGWADEMDFADFDPTQWSDADGDGVADEVDDECPLTWGDSVNDRTGCLDTDGDGWSDPTPQWPASPLGYADSHPDDATQWQDADGDGFGDSESGVQGDDCRSVAGTSTMKVADTTLEDWFGCEDLDNDGLEDDSDECPLTAGTSSIDRFGCLDSDSDGLSDLADDCFTQNGNSQYDLVGCPDMDGDGISDLNDPSPKDGLGTELDWDADGYPNPLDPSNITLGEDAFPLDASQWSDRDGDGMGDNPNGTNPDLFPDDHDNDGVNDEDDSFPNDPLESQDTDGDGIGDNEDLDADGDGYLDSDELRQGTDPFSSSSHPIDSFEVVVPGTNIGLGAWDLMGILGGLPVFIWVAVGLSTRGTRTQKFEAAMFSAQSEEELAIISDEYERALMWRMIGPHQALRLERIRSNLEVQFNTMMDINEYDGAPLMQGDGQAPPSDMQGRVSTDGYEWLKHNGHDWYRKPGASIEWVKWR
ncbi:FG-GAP-like repeat-containing protein [Deltaproteobacteria bacterium]|nr:FG-GAP-like repeat-containing protein [Deltaproteobacteria bacterium]